MQTLKIMYVGDQEGGLDGFNLFQTNQASGRDTQIWQETMKHVNKFLNHPVMTESDGYEVPYYFFHEPVTIAQNTFNQLIDMLNMGIKGPDGDFTYLTSGDAESPSNHLINLVNNSINGQEIPALDHEYLEVEVTYPDLDLKVHLACVDQSYIGWRLED